MDLLNDALVAIKNAERVGKKSCKVRHSKLVERVLEVMKENGYIENFEVKSEKNKQFLEIKLKHAIIDCNAIKPRFSVKKDEFEKWERRFLPRREYGLLILTTSKGILTHKKAKELGIGGKLLCYVY